MILTCCGQLNYTLQDKLKKCLTDDPSLLKVRATKMGEHVPHGFTPLMAAAYADNVPAAEIILEVSGSMDPLMDVDLEGKNAMHIAAQSGHMQMIDFLKPKYDELPVGSDLLGYTPLGRAIISPNPKAKKNQKELEQALYSRGDVSVHGTPAPGIERTGIASALQVAYALSHMPGRRVIMEDATCASMWKREGRPYCLVGVCDGHGDAGHVSAFVADRIAPVLQSNMLQGTERWDSIWTETCSTLDAEIKKQKKTGGSTAVLALISSAVISVANIGDSRCILVQSQSQDVESLSEKLAGMTVAESPESRTEPQDEGYPPAIDQEHPRHATPPKPASQPIGPFVVPLSEDHKPNLPQEQARIEQAGQKVVSVSFQENGNEITIHKVALSETKQLAVSRAFGDFEYKRNKDLGPNEQAVVAIPDVRTHIRDHEKDCFLVLACDGIWDVMSNEEVAKFVVDETNRRRGTSETVLSDVSDALLEECLNRNSRDNMTAVIVALSETMEQLSVRSCALEGKTLDFASPRKK